MTKTREDIIKILIDWRNNTLSPVQVQELAEKLWHAGEYDDYEDKDNSVSNEVLQRLECLDMNLIIVEDIEAYIEFLQTPLGKFHEGYSNFDNYLSSIDYKRRQDLLTNITPYAPFCK